MAVGRARFPTLVNQLTQVLPLVVPMMKVATRSDAVCRSRGGATGGPAAASAAAAVAAAFAAAAWASRRRRPAVAAGSPPRAPDGMAESPGTDARAAAAHASEPAAARLAVLAPGCLP
jgi:hypothetical protein